MPASSNKWIVGGIGGLVGGMVFAMWEMVVEGVRSVTAGGSFWGSLSTHSGVWAAPQFIGAALIRGLQTSRNPNFDLGPLILGPMSHMMNSIILGLIFVVFAYYLARSVAGLFMLGMAYGGRGLRRHVVAGGTGRRSCHAGGQRGSVLRRSPHLRRRSRSGGGCPSRECCLK